MAEVRPDRFDGWIAGLGTASGLRAVVGHWPCSPLGAFTDVMVSYICAVYRFDEVRVVPVTATVDGRRWTVAWISAVDVVARAVLPGVRNRAARAAGAASTTPRWTCTASSTRG